MTLHEALLKIRAEGPHHHDQGICAALSNASDDVFCGADLLEFFAEWPEFSGDLHYPVQDPSPEPECPRDVYCLTEDLWDRDTPYGAARWRLLDFLIERTTQC